MENKRIVVALGRNAFGETFPEQQKNVRKAAEAIADLVEQKYQIVVTHSNGPQVGMIQTAMTEFARLDNQYTVAPMSLCSAMSQGYIGYDLQNAIRTELLDRGIFKPVSTVITQVRVDPFDKAFQHPTKIIGRVMTKEEAEKEEEKGNHVVPEGDGYRRIIASPRPVDIYEIDAVKVLLDAGQIVIAAGGGGIPVMEQGTKLKGASAVIEKDYTAAKLADMIDASHLLILTAREQIMTEDGQQTIGIINTADAIRLIDEGHFDPLTTLPKMDAGVSFVSSGENRTAIITRLDNAYEGIKERMGTIIKKD
jgi:Carbamate kinase